MKYEILEEKNPSKWLILLLAFACGLIVANLYYAQPLVGPISLSLGISKNLSGLIVTMMQLGYIIGLLFLVPLSDMVENQRLVAITLLIAIIGLITAAMAKTSLPFFIAAILIGVGSVAAQILVPYASYLVPESKRGGMVGNIMSGLLLGIMFSRPVASIITDIWGWKKVFILSAILMGILIVVLGCLLPKRNPSSEIGYSEMIKSLGILFKTMPILRRRSLYQACLFGSFSLFWTVVPQWLTMHFQLSQKEIALFALASITGAVAAPVAGRLADKGWSRRLTKIAFVIASFSFAITRILQSNRTISLLLFCVAAILLDMAVSGNLVLGQQAIYALGNKVRGRVNGVFMAVFFAGGAIGSAMGGWAYANGGWQVASLIGGVMPIIAFVYFLTEKE